MGEVDANGERTVLWGIAGLTTSPTDTVPIVVVAVVAR